MPITQENSKKKLTQTRISSFFKCNSGIPRVYEEVKMKRRRAKPSCKKLFTSSDSESTDFSMIADPNKNITISSILVEKRKLVAPIFTDDDDSENDQGQSNILTSKKRTTIRLNRSFPLDSTIKRPLMTSTPVASKNQETVSSDTTTVISNCDKNTKICSNKQSCPSTFKSKDVSTNSPKCKIISNDDSPQTPKKCKIISNNNSLQTPKKSDVPKKITILDTVIIPPKQSPEKQVAQTNSCVKKDEKKKLNLEYLNVIREFYLNVLGKNHLKCLLSNEDKEILYKLFNIEIYYQYTCIKLFLWKPIWYNVFRYAEEIGLYTKMEDSEILAMYHCLKENNFIETDYLGENLFTLLNLLKLKDLREIQKNFKLVATVNTKDAIITKLLRNCAVQPTLTSVKPMEEVLREQIKKKMGFCLKLSSRIRRLIYQVYLLNTFANPTFRKPEDYFRNVCYQNCVFPPCKIEDFHIFYTHEEFAKYSEAVELRSTLENNIEKKNTPGIFEICKHAFSVLKELNRESNLFDSSRPPYLERFTANAQYINILHIGTQHLTSSHFNDVKLWLEYLLTQNYCSHKRADWYCQLTLIHTTYLKNYEAAAKLVLSAFDRERDHFSEIQLHELAYRGKVLNCKTYALAQLYHDQIADKSPPPCDRNWDQIMVDARSKRSNESGHKRKYVQECANGDVIYSSVEETAIDHYRENGYPFGIHCEGSIINCSFTLLFWDIIYEYYVKGTFVSSFQCAPLDMFTKYFYINREHLIKGRLLDVEERWKDEELKDWLIQKWNLHSHEVSLCPMDTIIEDPEKLYKIIMCIGRKVLSNIFGRLVKDFKVYRSGFPDLIVWNQGDKKAKFVEVKGENDKLSIKQKLWLNYLKKIGANVEVCHIHSVGSKKKILPK